MLPSKAYSRSSPIGISVFMGLNRRIKSNTGELFDMENMGHGDYPCLSSVKGSSVFSQIDLSFLESGDEIIKFIIPKCADNPLSAFTGVIKHSDESFSLYVLGTSVFDMPEFTDAIDFNGTIFVFPEFKGYNYVMQTSSPVAKIIKRSIGSWAETKLMRNFDEKTGTAKIYDYALSSFSSNFSVGESVAFSGFTNSFAVNNTIYPKNSTDYSNLSNPVSITITEARQIVENTHICTVFDFIMRNCKGEQIMPYSGGQDDSYGTTVGFTMTSFVPKADCYCASQNRLWVGNDSGEQILASSVGRPLEFYDYSSGESGSWYGEVGTPGRFTGMVGVGNKVIAFKADSMHIVYGRSPSEYSIEKNFTIGCIDKNSIACIGEAAIWLYYDGFYSYSGGAPVRISDKLNTKITAASAFTDGKKYYAQCTLENGNTEFLIFDTEYGFWSKRSSISAIGGDSFGGNVYLCSSSLVYLLEGGNYGDFYAETNEMTFDSFDDKSIIYAYIRCKIESGGFLNLYTSVNGGAWTDHKGISESGKHKLPIRYAKGDTIRLRIEGSGKVCVMDLELDVLEVSN